MSKYKCENCNNERYLENFERCEVCDSEAYHKYVHIKKLDVIEVQQHG